jgi:hypothetical protein
MAFSVSCRRIDGNSPDMRSAIGENVTTLFGQRSRRRGKPAPDVARWQTRLGREHPDAARFRWRWCGWYFRRLIRRCLGRWCRFGFRHRLTRQLGRLPGRHFGRGARRNLRIPGIRPVHDCDNCHRQSFLLCALHSSIMSIAQSAQDAIVAARTTLRAFPMSSQW